MKKMVEEKFFFFSYLLNYFLFSIRGQGHRQSLYRECRGLDWRSLPPHAGGAQKAAWQDIQVRRGRRSRGPQSEHVRKSSIHIFLLLLGGRTRSALPCPGTSAIRAGSTRNTTAVPYAGGDTTRRRIRSKPETSAGSC